MNKRAISFFKADEPYGFLSNFFERPIYFDGIQWPSSEHLYQASKFGDLALSGKVRAQRTPLDAATFSRQLAHLYLPNWEKRKDAAMWRALICKFSQWPDLAQLLSDTAPYLLTETNPNDFYWGTGKDGSGQNRLGQMLVDLRILITPKSRS